MYEYLYMCVCVHVCMGGMDGWTDELVPFFLSIRSQPSMSNSLSS
jgi:hypothetical protein